LYAAQEQSAVPAEKLKNPAKNGLLMEIVFFGAMSAPEKSGACGNRQR